MTITEQYLHQILPCLAGAEGGTVQPKNFKGLQGFAFPCPFCSPLQKRDSKKRERCAALMPHSQSFSYTFHCCRKQSRECSNSLSFPNFLKSYNPSLYRKYHLDRERNGTTGKGHNLNQWRRTAWDPGDKMVLRNFYETGNPISHSDLVTSGGQWYQVFVDWSDPTNLHLDQPTDVVFRLIVRGGMQSDTHLVRYVWSGRVSGDRTDLDTEFLFWSSLHTTCDVWSFRIRWMVASEIPVWSRIDL